MNGLNTLNKHVRGMLDRFMELYKKITAKSIEISINPLKILNLANGKVTELYHEVVDEKLLELTGPIYNLFNITKKIADEVQNATTYSLFQYKKFGKFIKSHTDYEKLWFENSFMELFEETENLIEHYWNSDKKICGTYSFNAGFKVANDLYDEYEICAARELNKTDDGINRFLMDLTDFEKEIEEGLYQTAKSCIHYRLKNDPVACLEAMTTMDLGNMINKQKIRDAAREARELSVKRVNECTSKATKKSLEGIKETYKQFVLCFESEQKKKVTSIKGINRLLLFLFEIGPKMMCPLVQKDYKPAKASTCGA